MVAVRSHVCLLAVATVMALAVGAAPAGEKANPIVAKVKASLTDPAKPFALVISIEVKEGAGAKFEEAFAKASRLTHKEKGCLAYDLNRDAAMPGRYLIYERWQNLAALDAHLKTDYITALLRDLGDLTAGAPQMSVLIAVGD
jgi:quinol monooxygenase YgiN